MLNFTRDAEDACGNITLHESIFSVAHFFSYLENLGISIIDYITLYYARTL